MDDKEYMEKRYYKNETTHERKKRKARKGRKVLAVRH